MRDLPALKRHIVAMRAAGMTLKAIADRFTTRVFRFSNGANRITNENERGKRREQAGGNERDARLVAQRREVVDAGEAHDLPPRRRVGGAHLRPDLTVVAFVEPVVQSPARDPIGRDGHGRILTAVLLECCLSLA